MPLKLFGKLMANTGVPDFVLCKYVLFIPNSYLYLYYMLLTDLGFNCIDYIVSLGTIHLFIIHIFRYLVISMSVVCKYTINLY